MVLPLTGPLCVFRTWTCSYCNVLQVSDFFVLLIFWTVRVNRIACSGTFWDLFRLYYYVEPFCSYLLCVSFISKLMIIYPLNVQGSCSHFLHLSALVILNFCSHHEQSTAMIVTNVCFSLIITVFGWGHV